MKNLLLTIVLSFMGSICHAQSDMAREQRQAGSFHAISVCCGIDVYITEGTSPALTVEANDGSLLNLVKTEVSDGILTISLDNSSHQNRLNAKMNVHLFADNLKAINASSGADVHSVGELYAEDIALSATSGADIKLHLNTNKLSCEANSGSDIELRGRAAVARLDANSSGDINMEKMIVKVVHATASSAGDIDVYVTDELNAKASSGSDIKYKGSPKTVNKEQSSGGSVKGN